MNVEYTHGCRSEALSSDILSILVRTPDSYEEDYLGINSDLICGFYVLGHVPALDVFSRAISMIPNLCIDLRRFGWIGRGTKFDSPLADCWPWIASPSDIVHPHWTKYFGGFARSKPGKRGAFPVTALLIESVSPMAGWHSLDAAWAEGRWLYAFERSPKPERASPDLIRASCEALIELSKQA